MIGLRNVISAADASDAVWDVVVVGAGPAGAVAAGQCARRGARTLLIDRDMPPRNKVCGGCLGHAGVELLNQIGLGACLDRCESASYDRIRIAAGRHRAELPVAPGRVVMRGEFDKALVEDAVTAGVEFLPKASAIDSHVSDDGQQRATKVRCGGESHVIDARCVIAADGLGGRFTRDAMGLDDRVQPGARLGVSATVRWNRGYVIGTVHMAMGEGGYVGVVRVSPSMLIVAGAFRANVVRVAGGPGGVAVSLLTGAGFEPIEALAEAQWKGTLALTRRRSRVAAHRLLAVGDTNGYGEPITGEGMTLAIASAITAAPLACEASTPDVSSTAAETWPEDVERRWTRRHRHVIRSRQRAGGMLHRLLNHERACTLAIAALSVQPQLASPFVARLSKPYPVPARG